MRLVSGSKKVGLQIEYVECAGDKDLQCITPHGVRYPSLRVQGVQRCQGKASRDQISTLKTFHKRPQRPHILGIHLV